MGDALDGRGCGPQDEFLVGAFQAEISRRIDAVGEVYADRAYGRAVSNTEPDGMHHVIEVLIIALASAKGDAAKILVDISHVMENDAIDVIAHQRKTQLGAVEQERIAAEIEAGLQVAGS